MMKLSSMTIILPPCATVKMAAVAISVQKDRIPLLTSLDINHHVFSVAQF